MILDVEVGTPRTHGCIRNLCGTMVRWEAETNLRGSSLLSVADDSEESLSKNMVEGED